MFNFNKCYIQIFFKGYSNNMSNNVFYIGLLSLLGMYGKVILLYEKEALNKENPKVVEIVAKSYLKEGIRNNIDDYLFKARVIIGDILSKPINDKKKLIKLYEKANFLFESITPQQKKMEFKAQLLSKKDINNSKPWLILFSNYDVSENPNSAILFLKNAIWKNPNCISAYYKLGYIFEKNLNKIDASIYYYKKAVLLNPNDDKCEGIQTNARYIQMACKQLAGIMFTKENYKAVILLLEKALPLSNVAGCNSHELIKDLIMLGVKSAEKLNIKGKFLNILYNKYNIDANILGSISFV